MASKKTAFIIDSTASMTKEMYDHPDVYVLSTYAIKPDGTEYHDTPEMSKEFYAWLKDKDPDEKPSTAYTKVGEFMDLYEQLISDGYERIISVLISSVTSGLYTTACNIASDYDDQAEFIMYDSKKWGNLIEAFAREAMKMSEEGLESDELVKRLDWLRDVSSYYWLLPNVDLMVAGGRLKDPGNKHHPKMKGLVSSDKDGYLYLHDSVRTKKAAYKKWIEEIKEAQEKYPAGINVYILHTQDPESVRPFVDYLKEEFPDLNVGTRILGVAMGAHAGYGTQGMAWCPNWQNYDLMN